MSRHAHRLSPGTHTVEMAQLADLNAALAGAPPPTAAQLGLAGSPVRRGSDVPLPAGAVLREVRWSGDPDFPDVHGILVGPGGARLVVDLHTVGLRALSRVLGLRQGWGVGPRRPGS